MTSKSLTTIDFMKYKLVYFLISAAVIIPGLYSLVVSGLQPSIDFTGGSLLEVNVATSSAVTPQQVRQAINQDIQVDAVQTAGENNFIIRTQTISQAQADLVLNDIASVSGQTQEVRFETVGPTLGKELLRKTLYAVAIAAIIITLYVMYRFNELKYGICAVLAMFHDTFIVVGVFSLLGYFFRIEVDALFVTAVLTVLSFSVHDTIVVYDRIRETLSHDRKTDFTSVVNKSVAETLVRSLNNSMTIIFMLLALWLLGGESIKWFVFALLIGTIAGTYSSTFTAAPLLVVWENLRNRQK